MYLSHQFQATCIAPCAWYLSLLSVFETSWCTISQKRLDSFTGYTFERCITTVTGNQLYWGLTFINLEWSQDMSIMMITLHDVENFGPAKLQFINLKLQLSNLDSVSSLWSQLEARTHKMSNSILSPESMVILCKNYMKRWCTYLWLSSRFKPKKRRKFIHSGLISCPWYLIWACLGVPWFLSALEP